MTAQVVDAPIVVSIPQSGIPRYITTEEAVNAPHTMTVHVSVSLEGQFNQVVDLCIPNDCTPCRPKIDEAVAHYLPGWTVEEWRDINSEF